MKNPPIPGEPGYNPQKMTIDAAHRGKPAMAAPELPTRAEREFEREFDAMELHFRERDFAAVLKNAQRLVLQAHALSIFGRQGVDAIPVDRAPDGFSYSDPAIVAEPIVSWGEAHAAVDKAFSSAKLLTETMRQAAIEDHKNREGSWDAPAGAGADVEADRG